MNGYILESKKIIDSGIWAKPPLYFKVWHYLLLNAQFTDKGSLKRGQLFTTINEIAEACSYYIGYRKVVPTRKEIWSVLEFLRKPYERDNEGDNKGTMIETTKVTHGIIITICNYNKYQDPKTYERNNEGNDEIRTKEQRSGQQGNNIINEVNEDNEINNIIPTVLSKVPYQDVVDAYHEECPSLPKVVKLTDTRKKHIKARLSNHSLDELREIFRRVEQSNFCKGDNQNAWRADFDFITRSEDSIARILEGKYDDRERNHGTNISTKDTKPERPSSDVTERERASIKDWVARKRLQEL